MFAIWPARFWRSALADPAARCLVPATSFCEYSGEKGAKQKTWFGLKDRGDAPFALAGIWQETADGSRRMAFLTCQPNPLVAAIHPKSMPVILDALNFDRWLTDDVQAITTLARPYRQEDMFRMDEAQA